MVSLLVVVVVVAAYYWYATSQERGAYRIGVHFRTAAGVSAGSRVFYSGVVIGSVQKVVILPDNSIDAILKIGKNVDIPNNSQIQIHPSFTAASDILIIPPRTGLGPPLEKRLLPIERQAVGSTPPGLETLMGEAKGVMNRGSSILTMAKSHRAAMMHAAKDTLANRDALLSDMHRGLGPGAGKLQASLRNAMTQMRHAQAALLEHNRGEGTALKASMGHAAQSMHQSLSSLQSIGRDPSLHANMRATMANVRAAQTNLSGARNDLKGVTTPQSRAQLRDAGAQMHAALQRIGSLLHRNGASPSPSATRTATPSPAPRPTREHRE